MFSSLRFRLPALFLAAIVLAGIVASLIAITALPGLHAGPVARASCGARRRGSPQLYAESARSRATRARGAGFAAEKLEAATGDRLFYVGARIRSPARTTGLTRLSEARRQAWTCARATEFVTFEFTPPGEDRTFLARRIRSAATSDGPVFGALVVAKPQAELRDEWVTLRSGCDSRSSAGSCSSAGSAVSVPAHHRPVLALSRRPTRSREGRYDVEVPAFPAGDEIGHLADRFGEMAVRLRGGGGARAQLPHVRLARAAHAADGDPRARRRVARGRRRRIPRRPSLARIVADEARAARPPRRRRARPREARRPPLHAS